jgi:two-component system, OmpR family, sensor histidine kinase KdpD
VTGRELVERLAELRGRRRHAIAIAASVVAVVLVTLGMKLLDLADVPVLSLGALYVFAVVPIAVVWGLPYAILVSVVSMLAFNFFFLPPLYTFTLADSSNWFALAVYLVTAVVVSELAARARRWAHDAEQQRREAALLAEAATELLRGGNLEEELEGLSAGVARVLRVERARIELGPLHESVRGDAPLELEAGGRRVGTLFVPESAEPNLAIRRRFLPALASLLAVAAERERLERDALEAEALRRSDTVKTAVLRAVSHDLRSPLTAIQTASEGLANESMALSREDRLGLLETIQLEARRLVRLVENLLDLSRLQAGAAPPTAELWPVDELVTQALAEVGASSPRVRVSIPTELPPVRVDGSQIERVLANLLENALKFSPEEVVVTATAGRKEVVVRVTDRGPGLSPRDLERIFEPFERAAGQARGTGLGLAISKGFVEANGGKIWAESRVGQGASFALALPAAPAPDRTAVQ